MDIKKSTTRLVLHIYTHMRRYTHIHIYLRISTCAQSRYRSPIVQMYVPATAKSHKKRDQRKASGRARQLCTSRLGSGLHLYPHALPRTPREPRGADAPIRAYNLLPYTLSLTRARSRFSSVILSLRTVVYTGDIPIFLSPNRPCVRAHTRVMNLSVRVRVHKRTTADSGQ